MGRLTQWDNILTANQKVLGSKNTFELMGFGTQPHYNPSGDQPN